MKTKTKTPPGDFTNFTGIYFGEYSLCFLIIGKGPDMKLGPVTKHDKANTPTLKKT